MTDTTNPQQADRRDRYAQALGDADIYALIERRDDRYRFADAAMTVADAEQADLRTHVEQVEDLLRLAHETSNRSEAERARAHDRSLTLQAELASIRDLLRTENARANAAIDRETTGEEAEEEQRLALSQALGLGTGAPWETIRDRAAELAALPAPADRAAKAESLLLHFAAEAHRRKWTYDRGLDDDGVPVKSDAFDALHRLGEEMRTALEKLRRESATQSASGSGGVAGETPQPDPAAEELTAEEARALVDQMGLDLYRAQDAIEVARECCDIADREQRPVTTADVREWLKGDRCTRQRAADEAQQPETQADTALRIRVLSEIIGRLTGSQDGDSATDDVPAATVRRVLAEILTGMQPGSVRGRDAERPAAVSQPDEEA
jgi:hypothetical protein